MSLQELEFKRIPNSRYDIRMNELGEMKSFEEGAPVPNTSLNRKGYLQAAVRRPDGGGFVFRIHRMVAMLFIPIPEKYKDVDITQLQVNHKNTIKTDNYKDNLEWMTNLENHRHARQNGLHKTEKPVLLKDKDGNIERVRTLYEVCKRFDIHFNSLSTHLLQKAAGCIIYEGYRFKYDNGLPWNDVLVHPKAKHNLRRLYNCTVTNILTSEKWMFTNLREACDVLGLNARQILNDSRKYPTPRTRDQVWQFILSSDNNLRPKQRAVVSLNRETMQEEYYPSYRSCAAQLGIPFSILREHLNSKLVGMIPWKGLFFRYRDEDDFPSTEYLIPNSTAMGKTIRYVVYKENDETPYLVTSIADICKHYTWSKQEYYTHRHTHGAAAWFKGLRIVDISDMDIDKLRNSQ